MKEQSGVGQRVPFRVFVADMTGQVRAAAGLERWLSRVAPSRARGMMTVALVPDGRIRALNRRYRGVNRVTDVLSFAMAEAAAAWPRATSGTVWLGDVVIAMGRARRQARQARHSVQTELRILTLHGLLHLLGYDHARDNGRMARLERRLRRRAGLPTGLIERTS